MCCWVFDPRRRRRGVDLDVDDKFAFAFASPPPSVTVEIAGNPLVIRGSGSGGDKGCTDVHACDDVGAPELGSGYDCPFVTGV